MWQRWHRKGRLPASTLSLFEPCGSWQVRQFSRTGACSHSMGPRLSMWQLSHSSLLDVARIMCGPVEPCGLWQLAQFMPPSMIGMWAERASAIFLVRWQVRHSSLVLAFLSMLRCPGSCASCMVWQLMHDTLWLACELFSHRNCSPTRWQVVQVALTWSAGSLRGSMMVAYPGFDLSPAASACADPGPWHDSQPGMPATTLESPTARPCPPCANSRNSLSWHSAQACDPTKWGAGSAAWERRTATVPSSSIPASEARNIERSRMPDLLPRSGATGARSKGARFLAGPDS